MTETEDLIKDYDSRIIRRLIGYLRPYKVQFVVALLALILASLGELYTPVLLQQAVDRYILTDYAAVNLAANPAPTTKTPDSPGALLPPPLDRVLKEAELFTASAPSAGERSDEGSPPAQVFVSSRALGELTRRERTALMEAGVLDETRWYLFALPAEVPAVGGDDAEVEALAAAAPGKFIFGADFGAIRRQDLSALSPETIKRIRARDFAGVRRVGGVYIVILAGILAFSFFQVYVMTRISQGVMKDMRLELLKHSFDQSLVFFNSRPLGSLVSRVTSDVETVNEFLTSVATSLFRDVFVMAGVVVILFSMNVRLALIAVCTLPPVFVLSLIFRWQSR
jgi:ABC-type multidrug transport system fused ATPase/permease subunit